MIINFHFDEFNGNEFVFRGPKITLDRNNNYSICLHRLHLQLKSNKVNRHEGELWALSTNLVDLSPVNPKQCISYFTTKKGRLHHDIVPCSFLFYPLETHHIENPLFSVQKIGAEQEIDIENALIQLEIRECLDFQNH